MAAVLQHVAAPLGRLLCHLLRNWPQLASTHAGRHLSICNQSTGSAREHRRCIRTRTHIAMGSAAPGGMAISLMLLAAQRPRVVALPTLLSDPRLVRDSRQLRATCLVQKLVAAPNTFFIGASYKFADHIPHSASSAGGEVVRAVLAVWATVARHLFADSGAIVKAEHLPALMPPLAAVLNRPNASEAAERVRPSAPGRRSPVPVLWSQSRMHGPDKPQHYSPPASLMGAGPTSGGARPLGIDLERGLNTIMKSGRESPDGAAGASRLHGCSDGLGYSHCVAESAGATVHS